MKNKIILLSFLFILFGMLPSAAADMIWTPLDEYLSHCDYLRTEQLYIAAGPEGWANAVDYPADPAKTIKIPNGMEFMVGVICGEGENRWVWVQNCRYPWEDENYYPDGFVSMNELVRGYDSAIFEEIRQDEIQPYAEDYDFCGKDLLEVHLTPDDTRVQYSFDPSKEWTCRENRDFRDDHQVDVLYVDSDGDRWVPIRNNDYRPDGWVNIGQQPAAGD